MGNGNWTWRGARRGGVRCLLVAAASAAAALGCGSGDTAWSGGSRDAQIAKTAGKSAAKDRFEAFRARKNGAGDTYRSARNLWKPFRVEAAVGLFDAKRANLGDGTFGVSVIDASLVGDYYFLTVRKSGDGIAVDAGIPGQTPIGTLEIPDALEAEVAFEMKGALMFHYARKRGDPEFTPLGVSSATRAGPYRLSLDMSDLPKGVAVCVDEARVLSNGPAVAPTAGETARETAYTAIDALLEATYLLDGASPDRAAAAEQIDLAVSRLDAALALDVPGGKSFDRKLASARKKAAGVAKGVRGKRSESGAIAALRGAVKAAGQAAERLK